MARIDNKVPKVDPGLADYSKQFDDSLQYQKNLKQDELKSINLFMNNDLKAIALFEEQKRKIDNFPSKGEEFWRIATLNLIEKYIGKKSDQYNLISGHTFNPNKDAINPETEQSQRERGIHMIDSCIDFIETYGVKKEKKIKTVIKAKNLLQSSNARDINFNNKNITQNTSHGSDRKWISELIMGIIIAVIGGLILWYLTK